jgi:hypothetical protein
MAELGRSKVRVTSELRDLVEDDSGVVDDIGAAEELVRAIDLFAARPAARTPCAELDAILDLVAAAALGTLSWLVGGPNGRYGAVAAYDEFHDLDAYAAVEDGEVTIEWGMGGRYEILARTSSRQLSEQRCAEKELSSQR